jgi:hypothetical protein
MTTCEAPDRLSQYQLAEEIDRLHAEIGARQRRLLELVDRLDDRAARRVDGCRDLGEWLSGRLGISQWAGRRWVATARALPALPETARALESGTLCLDKTLELSRFATPDTERRLIGWARRVSAGCIRRHAERASKVELAAVQDAESWRSVRWWYYDDGARMGLEGHFPAAQGAAIAKAIKRAADRVPKIVPEEVLDGLDAAEDDVLEKRCADGLWALCSQSIANDQDPDRATVVVHTVIDALGRRASSELENGPMLHEKTAERLECDARLQFVLTDKNGNALGIGRADRNPPPWLVRQVMFRDGGTCTFPGCDSKAFLQTHHLWHWTKGGPTDYWNLGMSCHFHHKLVHEGDWDTRMIDNHVVWFKPDGTRYEPGPDPPGR